MYKATVTKSLKELKQLNAGLHILVATILGGTLGPLAPNIGYENVFYGLLFFLFFMGVWTWTGHFRNKPRQGKLRFENDKIKLKWMKQDEGTVDLETVSPKYYVKTYRPLGILPKREYIHLLLDGGPFGPREFFFEHDGEYNASQWEKLPIEQLALDSSFTLAK